MAALRHPETLSITEATARGVSAIVREAGQGNDIVVERHGRAVAAVVSMRRLGELAELEADLRSAALVLARLATDDGRRTGLDDVIATRQPNPEPVPVWLVDRLVRVAKMERDHVLAMSPEDAMVAWEAFITRPPT